MDQFNQLTSFLFGGWIWWMLWWISCIDMNLMDHIATSNFDGGFLNNLIEK